MGKGLMCNIDDSIFDSTCMEWGEIDDFAEIMAKAVAGFYFKLT